MFPSSVLHCELPDCTRTYTSHSMWRGRVSSRLAAHMSQLDPLLSQLTACFWPPNLCLLENNKPPQADAGPDKELTLPVDSTTLDGSKSSDDQKIISYLWEKTQWVLTQPLIYAKVLDLWRARFYLFLRVYLLFLACLGKGEGDWGRRIFRARLPIIRKWYEVIFVRKKECLPLASPQIVLCGPGALQVQSICWNA